MVRLVRLSFTDLLAPVADETIVFTDLQPNLFAFGICVGSHRLGTVPAIPSRHVDCPRDHW